MMKKMILRPLLVLLLLTSPALASSLDEYRVVLKDGSWITAGEKPFVLEDEAFVRLPNGLLAIQGIQEIDWRRTEAWNLLAVYIQNVIYAPGGVANLNADPFGRLIPGIQEGEEIAEGEMPTLSDPVAPPSPEEQMRARIQVMGRQLEALKAQKADVEHRLQHAGSAREAIRLRREARDLDQEIRALRSEQARLILLLPAGSHGN